MVEDKKSLNEALDKAFIPQLPSEHDGKAIWLKAIAKVQKANMRIEYVLMERKFVVDTDANPIIARNEEAVKHDLGTMSPIAKILNIYPYIFLHESHIPPLKSVAEAIKFICDFYEISEDRAKLLEKSERQALVLNAAFRQQEVLKQQIEYKYED